MSTGRHILERYLDWTSTGLKPAVLDEALQINIAIILAIILNRFLFQRRIASPPLSWLVTILALFVSMQIPVQELHFTRIIRGLIFLVCTIGLVSLPHVLSFYLWPTEGARKRISLFLYIVVLGLFTADFSRR